MSEIKSVSLLISDGCQLFYRVGRDNVTEIKEAKKNGEMEEIVYYQIFKNRRHYSDVHHFTEVVYF